MKKFFNQTKKPIPKWKGYDESEYDMEGVEESEADGAEEYYAEDGQGGYYEADEGEEYYAEDDQGEYYEADGGEEYYAEDGQGEYYEADEAEEYYAEDGQGEYYEADGAEEYCAEDGQGEYYEANEAEEYYAEDGQGEYYEADGAEEYYAEDAYYEEEELYMAASAGVKKQEKTPKRPKIASMEEDSMFEVIGRKIASLDVMDKVMVIVGVFVLILAIITGSVFINARTVREQVSGFVSVGTELQDVTLIGGAGIEAVAEALQDRLNAAAREDKDDDKGYGEADIDRQVAVVPEFTSIKKDLKIKFVNQKTDKLVANVPFSVVVTDPDGKQLIWSDDDMDGIIYKTDIAAGTYKVAMEALTDDKYSAYQVTTDAVTTEVKKDITYAKVDVSNEVKQESEVNASKEDTKKNEVVVESTIQDTVAWVESKVIPLTYNEVAKSTIPDPLTLVVAKRLMMVDETEGPAASAENTETPTTEPTEAPTTEPTATPTTEPTATPTPEPTATPTPEPTATPTPEPTATPTAAPTATPTAAPTATPTAAPTATPTAAPTATPTAAPTATPTAAPTATPTAAPTATPTVPPTATPTVTPSPTPAPVKGSVSVDKAQVVGLVGTTFTATASNSGFTAGKEIQYSVTSDKEAVAKASIDQSGNITITAEGAGTATVTVKANYKTGGAASSEATATISVTVGAKKELTLSETAHTILLGDSFDLTATLKNALAASPMIKVETSDFDVAAVAAYETTGTMRIFGRKEGTATITMSYTEHGEEVKAVCEITVRKHPKEDVSTSLKDVNGQQLYVMDNGSYREAKYADYYTAEKFFLKGDVKYTGWQSLGGKIYYFTAEGEKVTGTQTIQGAEYNFADDGSLMTGSGVVGIDVSKWNGSIDWDAVKNSGVSYVIIRCGYRGSSNGKLVVDPKYEANIKGATAAGLKVGVYFFSQAINEVEAVEEASMVLDLIKNYKITYPVFLDVETSGGRGDKIDKGTRTAVCKAFCKTIQNANYTAGVYSNKQWLEKKLNASELSAYKIWLAQYAASPTYQGNYDMWQYTAKAHVNGISGDVDMNISYMGY